MKTIYEHDQMAWAILGTIAVLMIVFVLTFLSIGDLREQAPVLGGLIVILTLVGVLFYKGRIRVDRQTVRFSFGPGMIFLAIDMSDIETCRLVRHSVWAGYGIRRTRQGWLYNVSGVEAAEFILQSGKTIRLGTDEPERLCAAVRRALAQIQESDYE